MYLVWIPVVFRKNDVTIVTTTHPCVYCVCKTSDVSSQLDNVLGMVEIPVDVRSSDNISQVISQVEVKGQSSEGHRVNLRGMRYCEF